MSKRHFEELARIVKEGLSFLSLADKKRVAMELADFCKSQNPRFDRSRFYKACGFERGEL